MAICSRAASDLYLLSSQGTFKQMFKMAVNLKRFYLPISKDHMNSISFPAGMVDRVAESLTPEHYKQDNAKPITTKGDGNCLFNAASLALCGSEKLSAELRVRTTIELVEHLEFYKNHPALLANNEMKTREGQPWSISSIFQATIFSNNACQICANKGFDAALEHEIMSTARCGSFSTLLQIMGLASAIECQIHLIYPDTRHRMLGVLNGIYHPRNVSTEGTKDSIIIMWTNICGWPDRSKELRVNHFVPVLSLHIQNRETFVWNVVAKKRKGKFNERPNRRPNVSKDHGRNKNDDNFKTRTEKQNIDLSLGRRIKQVKIKKYTSAIQNDEKASFLKPPAAVVKEVYVDPGNQNPDTELHLSMPLLSMNWYEKTEKNANNILFNDNDKSILSMPLISQQFYSRFTDCAKSNTAETGRTPEALQDNMDSSNTHVDICIRSNPSAINQNTDQIFHYPEEPDSNLSTQPIEEKVFQARLPYLSKKWYQRRGRLATKNESRRAKASDTEKLLVNDEVVALQKPSTGKSIEESIQHLSNKLQKETNIKKRSELHALTKVGEFMLTSGPIISTQEAGKIYTKEKQLFLGQAENTTKRKSSSYLFSVFSHHLDIAQFYLNGKAYIVENHRHIDTKIKDVIERLNSIGPAKEKLVNDHLHNKLASLFHDSLRLMDTKRDRDILKGLFAKATSVNFTSKLQGTQNKAAIMNCRDELCGNLDAFAEVERTSMIVNNSMTNEQQRLLTKRIVEKRKVKEMKLKLDSRGRILKYEQWPDLPITLEYIFNSQDVTERAGGGLEAHSRLKNDILFRSKDNNTFMWQAHKIINAVSPPSFNISLSSCYNYTMTYKVNSSAAKRHHHGMDINAKISLHKPPHTKVDKLVVNLHYSTALVNYVCDSASNHEESTLVDSKDAKRIVCGDITPVQKPGKVWSNAIEYPDHDWDQSRTNAVTPMTHLLLRTITKERKECIINNPPLHEVNLNFPFSNTVIHITRTGQAITLINPSLLERETTLRLFHEILLLLTKPSLDHFFRNSRTSKLKEEFIFIVDNGPAEAPSSPLVQMLMVRLQKLLNIDRVVQVSFAEYHSKRNFVERVHATEDKLLSRHGPFSSHELNKDVNIQPGSKHHVENMERMANEVTSCLSQGRFDGKPLEVFRGVKNEWFLFDDEKELKSFLSRTEEAKENCDWTYSIQKESPLLKDLEAVWNIDTNFERKYIDDYRTLCNSTDQDVRTAWKDKYITAVYRNDNDWRGRPLLRRELQAIPDYLRWIQSNGELHYVSYERLQLLHSGDGNWQETPGLFRPDRLLSLLFTINHTPLNDMYSSFAYLTWLPQATVKEYFKQRNDQRRDDLEQGNLREKWRKHPLYSKKLEELFSMCKKADLPSRGKKHNLVEQLAKHQGDLGDRLEEHLAVYDGNINTVPKSLSELRKIPVARIKYILNYHGITTCGTKEELILRLFLICHGRYYLCFKQEEDEILKTIGLAEEIILEQRRQFVLNPDDIYRQRTHTTLKHNSQLQVPHATNFKTLQQIFKPIKNYITILKDIRREKDKEITVATVVDKTTGECNVENEPYEEYFTVGTKVKIRWTKEEIGDSGWRCGWYTAQVQESNLEEDTIEVLYFSEPQSVYSVCVSEYLSLGKLKLAN